MTTRDTTWPEGTPCWVDLVVDDFGQAQRFYSELFGWQIDPGPEEFGGYASCTKDGRNVAGIGPKMDPGQSTVWTTYLATEDLDATVGRVSEHGGQVVMAPMEISGMGRMALALDPAGGLVGFWEGASHVGFELASEPGSVTWSEHMSRDYDRAREFYAAVAGLEYDDMSGEGFQYATFKAKGNLAGGIGALGVEVPEEVPAHWNTYFKVADTDEVCAQVERLGGRVLLPAWDTEFGRMAQVIDDQGAVFFVMADVSS